MNRIGGVAAVLSAATVVLLRIQAFGAGSTCVSMPAGPYPTSSPNPAAEGVATSALGCAVPAETQDAWKDLVKESDNDFYAQVGATGVTGALQEMVNDINDAYGAIQTGEGNGLLPSAIGVVPVTANLIVDFPYEGDDGKLDFTPAKDLVMPNGTPVPGPNNREKVRTFIATHFERTARIFVSGTAQLNIDRPPYPEIGKDGVPLSQPTIPGLYQGFRPDLMNGDYRNPANPPPAMAFWGDCSSGVANGNNGTKRWFKSSNGSYMNESAGNGKLNNRYCSNTALATRPEGPRLRGNIVDGLMDLMVVMRADIALGHIKPPNAYKIDGSLVVPDRCALLRGDIDAYRQRVEQIEKELLLGYRANPTDPAAKNALSLQEQVGALECDPTGAGKTQGLQPRACLMRSMQAQVELDLVGRYAYCVWASVADEYMNYMIRKALAQNSSPLYPAQGTDYAGLPIGFLFGGMLLPVCGRRRRSRHGRNRATRLARAGVLALSVAALLLGGCKPKRTGPTSCGSVVNVDGGKYAFVAYMPTNPPAGFKPVPGLDLRNVFGAHYGYYPAAPSIPGSWVPICTYSCDYVQKHINELKTKSSDLITELEKQDQSNQSVQDMIYRAKQDLMTYNGKYMQALSDCNAQPMRVWANNRNEARDATVTAISENCTCQDPYAVTTTTTTDDPQTHLAVAHVIQSTLMSARQQNQSRATANDQALSPPQKFDGIGEAATAATKSLDFAGPGNRLALPGDPNLAASSPGSKAGGGASAGSAPGASSSGVFTDQLNPGPALGSGGTDGLGTGEAALADVGNAPGSYGPGRGGGAAAASAGRSSLGYSGSRGLASGQPSQVEFGSTKGDVAPMGSLDPEDYFARTNIDENLFKKVERVYRKQALSWALGPTAR